MAEENLAEQLFPTPDADSPPPQAEPPAEPPAPPAPEPEPVPAEPRASDPEPRQDHIVPLPKYLDERDRRRQAEQRLAELEARQQPATKAPDPIDDPDGYDAYQRTERQKELTAFKFEMSDEMARQAHGAEKVDEALTWATERAQKDPIFAAQYMRERHPIDWIVRQHKREGIMSQLPNDISSLDELIEREVATRLASTAPTPAPAGGTQPAAPAAAAPSKSLVDEPSSGGIGAISLGTQSAVETVFPR